VGRVSAQIDFDFDRSWPDQPPTAFFGFFECADRLGVARSLLAAAEGWARSKGRHRLLGPMTLDTKGEMGVLVEGFDSPPRIGMPYHLPHVGRLIEEAGYSKAKDLYAWWYTAGFVDEKTRRIARRTLELPDVRVRPVELRHLRREVEIFRDVYNETLKRNWCVVPLTSQEVEVIAREYKAFVDPELALIAEVGGVPAGMCFAIPDINALVRDLDGELMRRPWNLARLLWRLKFRPPKEARLVFLGVKEEFRASRKYGALAAALYLEVAERGAGRGYAGGELSWTLEDNTLINTAIERLGGRRYKTYRVYEKRGLGPNGAGAATPSSALE